MTQTEEYYILQYLNNEYAFSMSDIETFVKSKVPNAFNVVQQVLSLEKSGLIQLSSKRKIITVGLTTTHHNLYASTTYGKNRYIQLNELFTETDNKKKKQDDLDALQKEVLELNKADLLLKQQNGDLTTELTKAQLKLSKQQSKELKYRWIVGIMGAILGWILNEYGNSILKFLKATFLK